MDTKVLIISFAFLLAATFFTSMTKSLQYLGRLKAKKLFHANRRLFFFYFWQKRLFPKDSWDNYFFFISSTKHILRLTYAICGFSIIYTMENVTFTTLITSAVVIIASALVIDLLFRMLASFIPKEMLKASTAVGTSFLLLFCPIHFFLLQLLKTINKKKTTTETTTKKVQDKILELVHESELSALLDPIDQRIITSVASFRDRIAKEIMVPRIDMFCLDISQTVHEAATKFIDEGYSRIPLYKDSVDDIVGVLLFKDVVKLYYEIAISKDMNLLDTPLEKLMSPILYTPETKKISNLLQELRAKHIHIAIVVDEYGGTEGIVTIEDILEELVGEIADEYDHDEEILYKEEPSGGWIVDPKMNILDLQKELHIPIPLSAEYDTIGGYIYHKAGTIPKKGWLTHSDLFYLEVIAANERAIEKIHVKLISSDLKNNDV